MVKIGCIVTLLLGLVVPPGGRSLHRAFDEYGALCWEEEKARLDNFAIQLLQDATTLGHIIVYDGERACRGEALARAVRAKKYLVERRRVDANQVVWRWGGYQREPKTTLVIVPRGAEIWPLTPTLSPDQVTFVGDCRKRVRPVKCSVARHSPDATLPARFAQRAQDTSAAESGKYVGLRHGPSLPAGLRHASGGLISDKSDAQEHAVAEVRRGRVKMLWFERLTHRDDSGRAHWEVKDVLVLPAIPRKQILVYATCFSGQNPDKEIIAVADYRPDAEYFTRVRRAWRANRKTEKFEEILVEGIRCENDGYGV